MKSSDGLKRETRRHVEGEKERYETIQNYHRARTFRYSPRDQNSYQFNIAIDTLAKLEGRTRPWCG
jgi:hypothetical protein